MRFAIFGAGGLGGYYGARLAEAGHEVALIARGAHLEAIRGHGLRVASALGDAHVRDCLATDDPAAVGAVDAVIVAVKTWQVPEAARAMAPLVGPATGQENHYLCAAFSFGIVQGGGAGKLLADIIVDGEGEWDTWEIDPRRWGR